MSLSSAADRRRRVKRRFVSRFLLATLCAATVAFLGGCAGDMVLVTAKKTPIESLSPQECKELFLKKRQFVDKVRLIPVNLPATHPLRKRFERQVLHMGPESLAAYWSERHYNGIAAPAVQPSVESLKTFLHSVDGSVGYLDSKDADSRFTVLMTLRP